MLTSISQTGRLLLLMGSCLDVLELWLGLPLSYSTLATDNLLMSSWTSGADETWSYMQRDCEVLSERFGEFSERAKQQGVRETSGFTETVHLFLDLIVSYQELCERRERTVQRKHQKALAKVHTMVNYKERVESTGKHLVSTNGVCCEVHFKLLSCLQSEKDDSRIIRVSQQAMEGCELG